MAAAFAIGKAREPKPLAAALIVLALTSKRSRAPKAEGIPYDKGMR